MAQQPAIPAWWTVFNDPELTKLAEQTLGGNFSLKSAVARVDEARAAIRVATSTRQPEVTLDPQAYITRLSGLRPVPFALGAKMVVPPQPTALPKRSIMCRSM
ncbi:hypothetical protein H9L05_14810 [Hymenobacter qilianensis]|uniref:TolC family protein n=1 Tax=Hymenobacter qilianensis TaxID=1385715 RepID=A0A7H0GSQ4_9BACT|nr:hypothetical protein [Hymenobacter qilianensis]QNP51320.1 hypothetical protein H9L05_14810 [Hymenobacter qilianensis]